MRSSFVTLYHKFPFVTFATTIDGDILPRVTGILEYRRSPVSALSHLDDSWTYDTLFVFVSTPLRFMFTMIRSLALGIF
jgi:hypothetical protein